MSAKRSHYNSHSLQSAWRVSLALAGLLAAPPALAQGTPAPVGEAHAATLYEKACYSCHNIGGGDKKGPDLMDLLKKRDRPWLHRFILSPRALRDAGDPAAVKLFEKYAPEEMDDQMLSADQIDEILELIENHSKRKKKFIPTSGKLARKPVPADIPAGGSLFLGQTKLKKGGPSCFSCHSVAGVGYLDGGTLGPDLTDANRRYAEVELASILKAPAFPTMSKLYANRQLTDEEVVKVFAFLRDARTRTADTARASSRLLAWSALGLVAVFGVMSFIWRDRLRHESERMR